MTDSRMKLLLFLAIFVVCSVQITAAFYWVDDALQRSLNLGFNPQIVRSLDLGAKNLKTLKTLDPANEARYRAEFEEVQDLTRIYAQPQWVKRTILGSLKIYFGLGLVGAVLVSLVVAALLGRRISHSYRATFDELMAHREKVRYLQEMSSWQEMAKALAHEIKNPLTPIEVLVTSLTKAYASKLPGEFQVQLHQTQAMIEEEIGHLKRTVSRYSDFARLPPAELAEAKVMDVIRQHLPAVSSRHGTGPIAIRCAHSAEELRAKLDSSLFRSVLMNIIANGVEANPGRRVEFSIEVAATNASIQISISNDGDTVPAPIAARIFDPYISARHGRDNMGLGLAIVKKIIVEHEGQITYGEIGGHPRFSISLPRVA
jgi:signal transduction histidine kinase